MTFSATMPEAETAASLRSAAQAEPTRARTRLETLLPAVLRELGWRRADPVYQSALARTRGLEHLDEAPMLLAVLEFPARVSRGLPQDWVDGLDGAVIVQSGGECHALVRVNGTETALSTGKGMDDRQIERHVRHGDAVLFIRRLGAEGTNAVVRQQIMDRVRSGIRHGLFMSFFVNAFAVTIPIFTMTIFDRVIGANAIDSLWPLIAGAVIVVGAVTYLRRTRARYLAAQHARLSAVAGSEMETRLLRGGLLALQKQSIDRIDARIARVRRIADLFSASNTAAVFDAPFILLSILVIGFIGGVLAVVSAVYLGLFVIVALAVSRSTSRTDPEFAKAATERTALLHELGMRAIELRQSRVAGAWLNRFAEMSRLTARGAHRAGVRQAAVQSLGSVLGTGAALTTLVVGVDLAITGIITPGTLVATMLLTWRITGPAQAFFLGVSRIRADWQAIGALEQSLAIPTVTSPAVALRHMPATAPGVEAAGVFFRHDAETEPALTGLSFRIEPGTVAAVIGPNGAGKTTLLRVLAGTLTPQSGQVFLNGVTMRQFDPDELSVSTLILPSLADRWSDYGPEPSGTGAETLPGASWTPRQMIDDAMGVAMGTGGPDAGDGPRAVEPDHVFMLLDDPTACADAPERAAFRDFVSRHKGRATIVFSTHDTSLLSLADTAIVLNNGALAYAGPVKRQEEPVATGLEING